MQDAIAQAQIETDIAARHGMADLVALMRIEEQHLVAFRNCVVAPDMAHEDAAIGKDQMGGERAFLATTMPALAGADDVAHQDDLAVEQLADRELQHPSLLRHP